MFGPEKPYFGRKIKNYELARGHLKCRERLTNPRKRFRKMGGDTANSPKNFFEAIFQEIIFCLE